MLAIPDYIRRLEIADATVAYGWNDADPGSIHRQDDRLATIIARTTDRGVVALSCGFAEWIAWRLHKRTDVLVLLNEIEAVWAGIIDWHYLGPLNRSGSGPKRKESQGPVLGPVFSTFYLLGDVVWRAKRRHYSGEASSCLSTLAAHMLPDPQPFLEWRGEAIKRLSTFYPFALESRVGPRVPREALDPDCAFQSDMADEQLARFLRSLDYKRNPFLRSPDEMIADGFEGTPYQL